MRDQRAPGFLNLQFPICNLQFAILCVDRPLEGDLMAFVTRCPHCQKPVQVQDAFAGKQVQCGSCKQVFVAQAAPARQPVAAAAPTASFAPPTPPPAPQRSAEARPKASTAKVDQAQQPTGQVCPSCKAKLPAG